MTKKEINGADNYAEKDKCKEIANKSADVNSIDYSCLKGLKVGFAITGSHCTIDKAIKEMKTLRELGAFIVPIISDSVRISDTRFGRAKEWREKIIAAGGNSNIIDSIVSAEPVGPDKLVDIILIAPCSGNTLGKLANGISDSPVLMAAKANLRNQRPLVLAISTNDGLGGNCRNIGQLLNTKNIFFVPFRQDNPYSKPNSLMAEMPKIPETIIFALKSQQIQPLLLKSN